MKNLRENLMHMVFFLCALTSIFAVVLICIFLFANGVPAMKEIGLLDFLTGAKWKPGNDIYGILPMILGSLYITAGAIVIGVPIGLLTAVFMAFYCPKKLYGLLKPCTELLAGIPSIVYGFFGMVIIVPAVRAVAGVFGADISGSSILAASILLGIMILPTIIGVSEAALRAVHLPRVFVDALAVAFRVIPTVGSEAVAIREAMEMRGVDLGICGVVRHPLVIAERFLVPLLSSIARVADDLAASSVVRGLGGPTRPTSLTRLRASVWDALALTCVIGVIVIEICAHLGVLP